MKLVTEQGVFMGSGHIFLVALGANVASKSTTCGQTVMDAMISLKDRFPNISVSSLYETPSFPAGSGPDYVNAACSFTSEISSLELIDHLHNLEAKFRRVRTTRWGERTLDLDLIACGDEILPDSDTQDHWRTLPLSEQRKRTPDRLILPHPRVQDRAFVLVPLLEVAPEWIHPRLGLSVRQMLGSLPAEDVAQVARIS